MNSAGPTMYGSPCRECGFDWFASRETIVAAVESMPGQLGELLDSARGDERRDGLAWSAAEYVSHVADNLRIWAERLVGARRGPSRLIGPYDQDDLARARNYPAIPLSAALWSLGEGVRQWSVEIRRAFDEQTVLDHPEAGQLEPIDVLVMTAHDALHHVVDIRGILSAT